MNCIISCHNLTFNFFEFTEATADELRLQREEKKRYLLRKLSFRPSVDELKNRKVNNKILIHINYAFTQILKICQDKKSWILEICRSKKSIHFSVCKVF